MRNPDFLPIEFIIVGGAVSGLTAAIALSRIGHKVTVIEVMPRFDETSMPCGGSRIPPNATKVFYRWGMEQRLRQCSVKSTGIMFAKFDSGSVVGAHDWEESVLEETGGDFLLIHYADLRRILAESAAQHGAILRSGCPVVDVHPDQQRPYVTLDSGEVLTADVIIGADGCYTPAHQSRRVILKALRQPDTRSPRHMQLYSALIPESALKTLRDKQFMGQMRQTGKVFIWFGPTYGALGYPVKEPKTGAPLFTLSIYVKRDDDRMDVGYVDKRELLKALEGYDPRLTMLAEAARHVICVPMVERPFLEEWVHPQGRVIAIGEAAHPLAEGSMYGLGMAAGDAAVLGRIFSHLHSRAQISTFLSAVQEVRARRVERVVQASMGNIFAVALPPGVAEARDREMQRKTERGIESLGTRFGAQTSVEMINAIEGIFAYDPEDEADNWWVQWGLTQERAARIFSSEPLHFKKQGAH